MLLSVCLTSVCRVHRAQVEYREAWEDQNWHRGSQRHTWLGHHFRGQKVKGQLVADALNSQHAGTGATWRINTKIVSTCSGRMHIVVAARLQLVQMCSTFEPVLRFFWGVCWDNEWLFSSDPGHNPDLKDISDHHALLLSQLCADCNLATTLVIWFFSFSAERQCIKTTRDSRICTLPSGYVT